MQQQFSEGNVSLDRNPIYPFLIFLLLPLLLAACGSPATVDVDEAAISAAAAEGAEEGAAAAVQTAVAALPTPEPLVVEMTREVEVTRLVVVTATPTSTPEATPTPTGYDITASQVLTELIEAGLPIGDSVIHTAETDPNELLGRPGQYTSKVNFRDTRLAVETPGENSLDDGGAIEVFPDIQSALNWVEYNETVQESLPMFARYLYREDNIVLRLTKRLTPEQAAEYEAALTDLVDQLD